MFSSCIFAGLLAASPALSSDGDAGTPKAVLAQPQFLQVASPQPGMGFPAGMALPAGMHPGMPGLQAIPGMPGVMGMPTMAGQQAAAAAAMQAAHMIPQGV